MVSNEYKIIVISLAVALILGAVILWVEKTGQTEEQIEDDEYMLCSYEFVNETVAIENGEVPLSAIYGFGTEPIRKIPINVYECNETHCVVEYAIIPNEENCEPVYDYKYQIVNLAKMR